MTEIRHSFHRKMDNKKKNSPKKKSLGCEFGAIIENNPENYTKTGEWKDQLPMVSEKCIACGTCVEFCPEGAIEIKVVNGKKKATIDYSFCKGCGICSDVCPVKAIEMRNQR